jgi:transposase
MRTFEHCLYPNKAQARALMACLSESRRIYNEMLAASKENYEQTGKFLMKYDLTAQFKGRGGNHVPASAVQMLADLLDKPERAGHQVVRVNPRFTSQKCSQCGALVQKSLSVRTHLCPFCGFVGDRDVNAKNILSLAGAQPSDLKHSDGSVGLRSPRL